MFLVWVRSLIGLCLKWIRWVVLWMFCVMISLIEVVRLMGLIMFGFLYVVCWCCLWLYLDLFFIMVDLWGKRMFWVLWCNVFFWWELCYYCGWFVGIYLCLVVWEFGLGILIIFVWIMLFGILIYFKSWLLYWCLWKLEKLIVVYCCCCIWFFRVCFLLLFWWLFVEFLWNGCGLLLWFCLVFCGDFLFIVFFVIGFGMMVVCLSLVLKICLLEVCWILLVGWLFILV